MGSKSSTNAEREAVISFLKHDRTRNVNMIRFTENYAASIQRVNDSVILRGKSDRPWVYLSIPDPRDLSLAAADLTDDDRCFAAIEDWVVPTVVGDREVAWMLPMMRLFLCEGFIVSRERTDVPIRPLAEEDAGAIYENSRYKKVMSPGYIRDRIRRGPSAGIYESDRPVAWILTHDDGSMGAMHVLDDYRQRGYAHILTLYLIDRIREEGKIPYIHVEETNEAAIRLAAGLGFQKDRRLCWFEIKPAGKGR